MNKEVIKAMNKKPNTMDAISAWWGKNSYKVWRVILFPVWAFVVVRDKYIEPKRRALNAWDESRADEILNYYVPRFAKWNKEENAFYFFDNGSGWLPKLANKHLKLRDRKFWKINTNFYGGKMREYLIEKFELDGFTKEVGDCYDGDTDICFKANF